MSVNRNFKRADYSQQELLNYVAVAISGVGDSHPDALAVYIEGGAALAVEATITGVTTILVSKSGEVDITGAAMDYTTDFADKIKVVGIYLKLSTSKARNISISVMDTGSGINYAVISLTGATAQNLVITDEFILSANQEIRIEVSQASGEDATANYRVDAIDL